MKTMAFFALLILFLPSIASAQDKIEAPLWNVGDKWNFTGDGSIEVVKADQNGYILKFSEGKCIFESQGCSMILFETRTLNRMSVVDGGTLKKYTMGLTKLLNFPLGTGKEWKHSYSAPVFYGPWKGQYSYEYSENYRVLGWEEVEVRAGKFKVVRLEYNRKVTYAPQLWAPDTDEVIKHHYWYSPAAKYFVKCQYDKDWIKVDKEIFNWELASFQLRK